ncbi:MAG TPA: nuclear transport factor 2 family protein [Ignavibacteriaceae bacterium]|nr:nuclear transport factor 2 family protein [Ignavibacteriaceae bacterium]
MKVIFAFLLLFSFCSISIPQESNSIDRETIIKQITQLEEAELKAILESDTIALRKMWAEDVHVNSPTNIVVNRAQVFDRIKSTFIKYSLYTREQEYYGVYDDVVIVMGNEVVIPSGDNPAKGKTLKRRYTNVYKKFEDGWRLIARHANIIRE